METGALIRDAGGRVPGGCGAGEDWFAPFRPSMPSTDPRAAGRTDLESLNRLAAARGLRTESGLPLRFVDANEVPSAAYERVIHERGEVPTRLAGPGMLHDWFNARAWIAWPRTKLSKVKTPPNIFGLFFSFLLIFRAMSVFWPII